MVFFSIYQLFSSHIVGLLPTIGPLYQSGHQQKLYIVHANKNFIIVIFLEETCIIMYILREQQNK